MSARFGSFETKDAYAVSTYCDPRWKDVFFQNTETKSHVESVLAEEILAKVKGPSPPPPISRIPSTSSQSSLNDSSEEQTFEAAMKSIMSRKKPAKAEKTLKNLVESHEFSYHTNVFRACRDQIVDRSKGLRTYRTQ